MGRSKPTGLRLSVVKGRQTGKTLEALSAEYGLSYGTVQGWCARYKAQGEEGLTTRYSNCGKTKPDRKTNLAYRAVLCFKTWHPSWGAQKICSELLLLNPNLGLPDLRTVQKWLSNNGHRRKRKHQPKEERRWGKQTHEVWQVDAKEELQTQDGQKSCWLNIRDEHSGGVIDPPVFPL